MVTSLGFRWGVLMAHRRRLVLAVWMPVLIACGIAYGLAGQYFPPADLSVAGSDSARAAELASEHFAEFGTERDLIVFDSAAETVDSGEYRQIIDRALESARASAGVAGVIGPFDDDNPFGERLISSDRRSAFAVLALEPPDAHQRARDAADIQEMLGAISTPAVDVTMTGFSAVTNDLTAVERADTVRAEAIGLPVALIVLLLALGSVFAASVPMAVAGAGLLCAFGVIVALMPIMSFSALLVTIATTLGTGVGIDYSLFVVSRFREELARRGITDRSDTEGIAESVGVAIATAGRTITISALIVVITLSSLLIVDSPVFREITIGICATVLSLVLVSLTFMPAMLAWLGPRVNKGALPKWSRPADTKADSETPGRWAAWAHLVMRRPVMYAFAAVAVLIVATLPLAGLTVGLNLGGDALDDTASGRANTVLAEKFTPGLLGPIEVIATGADDGPLSVAQKLRAAQFGQSLSRDPRISSVISQESDGRMLWLAIPSVPIDSSEAAALVQDMRERAPRGSEDAQILIGGASAQFVDLAQETASKFGYVLILVLAMSLVFLGVVFRSVVLPIKAVVMNLLVTGASVGLTVAVFQWGHGSGLLGFTSVGYLQVYVPITVFVVLFGLSMDYEVFLLARIKEAWDRADPAEPSADRNARAVAEGLEHTARPITAAAAIMVAVFLSLLTANVLELKQFGFSLALAIALDAVLVRLVLVPAFMKLFGRWNWWPGTRGTKPDSGAGSRADSGAGRSVPVAEPASSL